MKNNKELNKDGRLIYCTNENCKEKAVEFGKCFKHLPDFLIDDLPKIHEKVPCPNCQGCGCTTCMGYGHL